MIHVISKVYAIQLVGVGGREAKKSKRIKVGGEGGESKANGIPKLITCTRMLQRVTLVSTTEDARRDIHLLGTLRCYPSPQQGLKYCNAYLASHLVANRKNRKKSISSNLFWGAKSAEKYLLPRLTKVENKDVLEANWAREA
eukprot:3139047-Karenia_brevis.AAC.1